MITPDYVRILKLDKLAMKSKSHTAFLEVVKGRLQYARNLGVGGSFPFFVDQAWSIYGNGE